MVIEKKLTGQLFNVVYFCVKEDFGVGFENSLDL